MSEAKYQIAGEITQRCQSVEDTTASLKMKLSTKHLLLHLSNWDQLEPEGISLLAKGEEVARAVLINTMNFKYLLLEKSVFYTGSNLIFWVIRGIHTTLCPVRYPIYVSVYYAILATNPTEVLCSNWRAVSISSVNFAFGNSCASLPSLQTPENSQTAQL